MNFRQDQVLGESVRRVHGIIRCSASGRPDEPAVPVRPRRTVARDPYAR